ncbi:MAG: neutral/alkaline non-lysosomal ceramidase N-terminal domain-containing protein [Planctomycetota bacterium]|nr:neutral/alkaline non-lysosomal ceramidase N-terminal domain-containing protein [Planctomycetota bacterium]
MRIPGSRRPGPLVAVVLSVAFSAIFAARPASAELLAGVARADITPPTGGRMYGYGARGRNVSQGVHDRLHARAIVLSDGTTRLAIATLDLGSITRENTARVRRIVEEATGIRAVLLVASHTHSAPSFTPDFPSPDKPYVRDLERRIAGAIVEASLRLKPARIGVGRGRVEVGHNRRQVLPDGTVRMLWRNREGKPTSPLDHSLGVVAVDTPEGEAVATLVNFACHPVILGPENLEISADYPGAMMAHVEKSVGGQCMFLQGAAGDINPHWDKTPPAEGGFEQVPVAGEKIGREVLRVREAIRSFDGAPRLGVERQVVQLDARWDLGDPRVREALAEQAGRRILKVYTDRFEKERDAEVSTVLIGPRLALAFFPGEFFVEHGLRLKRASLVENTFFVGYANGASGYFPTIRAAAEGGYGAKESATVVEVGAGEKLVNRALIQLHYQVGKLQRVPRFGD